MTKYQIAGILVVEAASLPQSLKPIACCQHLDKFIETVQAVKEYPIPRAAILVAEEAIELADEVIELGLESELPAETSASRSIAALLLHVSEIKEVADAALTDFDPVYKDHYDPDYPDQKLADSCPLEF
jgi:hypothetical protein